MEFSQIADIADVLTAVGVIVSLLFVAYEVRRNTNEIKRTAWEANIDRFNAMWSRTSSADLADILDRGRRDFQALSGPEKIVFGNYHNEMCLTYETMIVLGRNQSLGDQLESIPLKHLRYYFGFAGTRQWWREFAETRGLSPVMNHAMEQALSASDRS